MRLLMPLVLGALVLAWQGRLPLTAAAPGAAGAPSVPGAVDPQAEADGIALALRGMADRLRGAGAPAGGAGAAPVPPPPSPAFHRPPGSDVPRVRNGGGAGHFQRPPAAP
jgi:hypothetical protein